ncbi:caspase activity and apoptosis inhibitor 1 isoform X2 [Mastacembelus armatus]|uniref:caspase activity and apoptosis inhibitor 1 isoform X2 n=1 Tax=Mastacembelus armatus TaxID=205130 RepID=UPI000E4649B3|nr:caspase activity and apoptosis inhibitor 1 isoform X2 [Mastacembelus armatus]
MLKKKSSNTEKKRKHSQSDEKRDGSKRRSTEPKLEDELADPELDRIGSDIEEGGLDLNLPFQPITAYVSDKQEMLEQCFHALGEKKLRKMLPDELKDCSLTEIKTLCWEQLESISEKHLTQILSGEELTYGNTEETLESQQDNNVDSTSSLKETAKTEEPKQAGAGVTWSAGKWSQHAGRRREVAVFLHVHIRKLPDWLLQLFRTLHSHLKLLGPTCMFRVDVFEAHHPKHVELNQ